MGYNSSLTNMIETFFQKLGGKPQINANDRHYVKHYGQHQIKENGTNILLNNLSGKKL